MTKELLGALAIALTFIAYFPYIRDIWLGKVKPHVFSWVIWGTTTTIIFFAQISDGGGAGAWPTAVSGLITLYVAVLAYQKKGDITITSTDWLFFIIALTALPLWFMTSSPLVSVLLLTAIDLIGFVPTFRKTWHFPFEEQLGFFNLMGLKYIISLLALEHYSLITILFPTTTAIACFAFVIMALWRRRQV